MPYRALKSLEPYVERAFQTFYDEILSHEAFATHFRDEAQVRSLLVKQKENFNASLNDGREAFIQRFIRLGVMHYDLGVPFEGFQSGVRILRNSFITQIIQERRETHLVLVVNDYFETSNEATAKGYLERFIENDANEIAHVMSILQESHPREKGLRLRHHRWLKGFFDAIRAKDRDRIEQLGAEKGEILGELGRARTPLVKGLEDELERTYSQLAGNASNILFFLERDIYTEALSLFIKLLETYKFALIFSNMVSVYLAHAADEIIAVKTRQAEQDPLTGALDRVKFDELMDYAVVSRTEQGQSFSIVVIDIDGFKFVNDRFGHLTGDSVLRNVAAVITGIIRKNDLFVRYGGDEFVVLCLDTDQEGAASLAEKIRAALESFQFEQMQAITASFGVAEWAEGDDALSLFARADEALYRAKQEGRNRVEIGTPSAAP